MESMTSLRFVIWTLIAFFAGFCLFALAGCSATKQIATAASKVTADANDIRTEVVGAKHELAASTQPAVVAAVTTHLNKIDTDATDIQKNGAAIAIADSQVQDVVPYWEQILKWGLVALVVVGVIFVIWRLNGFILIENGLQVVSTFLGRIIGAI